MVIFKSVRVIYLSEAIKHKGFFKKENWLRYEKDNSIKQRSLGLLTLFYFNNELCYPRVYLYQLALFITTILLILVMNTFILEGMVQNKWITFFSLKKCKNKKFREWPLSFITSHCSVYFQHLNKLTSIIVYKIVG